MCIKLICTTLFLNQPFFHVNCSVSSASPTDSVCICYNLLQIVCTWIEWSSFFASIKIAKHHTHAHTHTHTLICNTEAAFDLMWQDQYVCNLLCHMDCRTSLKKSVCFLNQFFLLKGAVFSSRDECLLYWITSENLEFNFSNIVPNFEYLSYCRKF